MTNLQKAKRAFGKACAMAFLDGRRCSFVNDRYHEDYLGGEVELFVYRDDADGRISIRGEKSFNGWYDSLRLDISSSMAISDICGLILDMLDCFRRWVRQEKSKG